MQQTENIKQHQIKQLKISDLVIDLENPNYMTDEQMEALRMSMRKFGYLDPIIVDQDNLIADGQHRVEIYKEFGKEFIDGYQFELSDNDRRILRQVRNKLKGQHEPQKEYNEFVKLLEGAKEGDKGLLNLLNVNRNSVMELESLIQLNKQREKIMLERMEQNKANQGPYFEERVQDGSPLKHHAQTFLFGNIKQITAFFDNDTFEDAMVKIKTLMNIYKIGNHTDLFWSMLNHIYAEREFKNMDVLHVKSPERSKMEYEYT